MIVNNLADILGGYAVLIFLGVVVFVWGMAACAWFQFFTLVHDWASRWWRKWRRRRHAASRAT